MICHIPTIYLEAETKLPPVLTHTERFLYLTIWFFVLWEGGGEETCRNINQFNFQGKTLGQTIWVEFCHKNLHIGYPKHYIPKLCLFFLKYTL